MHAIRNRLVQAAPRFGSDMTFDGDQFTTLEQALLEVFVAPGCYGCDTALTLAESIRDREIPGLRVDLIDLTDPEVAKPSNVFAVPTYRLDGKVISLGNPEESDIIVQLLSASGISSARPQE